MKWHELRIKCKRNGDYIITLFITNEISLVLTWLLMKTRVTPNHVTFTSMFFGMLCGLFYAFGFFLTGSIFLFSAHVLDCTDGNLARAKEMFSSSGRWLDLVGDRAREVFIFIGVSVYFYRIADSYGWILLTLSAAVLHILYYYIVDIGLALGASKTEQKITKLKFKDVQVKWGIFEPFIYGFIVLTPLGLLKIQIVLILLLTLFGLIYQYAKLFFRYKSSL